MPHDQAREGGALRATVYSAVLGAAILVVITGAARVFVALPAWTFLVAAALGAVIGGSLGPFVSLARADGSDAEVVWSRTPSSGRADAPTEGGEAADAARQPVCSPSPTMRPSGPRT
jgi:hypothetical protein